MDIALKDKPLIIESKVLEIEARLKSLDFRFVNEEYHKIDKELLEDLKNQSGSEQKLIWRKNEFKERLVINSGEKINLDSVKIIINSLNEKERRVLINEFKKYNAKEIFSRNFPLSISNPIYSSDGNFVVMGFSRGNNGGEMILYKRIEDKWKFEAILTSWVY
jgi:hypothetical protein